jgi:O-antigen/teichoic acid export membrane protein
VFDAVLYDDLARHAGLGWLTLLIPPAMLAAGMHAMFQGWFIRHGSLRAVGRAQIGQSTAQTGLCIAGGLGSLGAGGLVGAAVLSSWVGIGTMLHEARELPGHIRRLTVRRIWTIARRFGPESGCSTAVSICNVLAGVAPVVLLSHSFAANEVGWYALAVRLVYAPLAALVKALGQSFWSHASELIRNGRTDDLSRLYLNTTGILGLACIPVVLTCIAGSALVGPIFGTERWAGAGPVILALAPMLVGTIVFSATSHLVVFGMQGVQAIADALRLALICCSIIMGSAFDWSFVYVVLAISVSSLIGYLGLFAIHLTIHARIKLKH